MARYVGIPAVPMAGVEEWQAQLLNSLKENVELLAGIRGEPDGASAAINRSSVTVPRPPTPQLSQVSARGSGVVISDTQVPLLQDYTNLVRDVQALTNDVAALRTTLDTLITQLRG